MVGKQTPDARGAEHAPPLPAHIPTGANELLITIDEARAALLAKAPPAIRELSFQLFEAALVAAIHGEHGVGKELANRVRRWGAGRRKRYQDEVARFHTAHAVKHSHLAKSRGSRSTAKTAFEDVAERQGISAVTAEKRAYRKPRP